MNFSFRDSVVLVFGGAVAQLVQCATSDEEILGSIPAVAPR